jgi:DNA invertase Pin-like site-specific DNA recombinase
VGGNRRGSDRTRKAIAARRLQGQYIGNLRKVAEKDRDRFRTMAKEQGVAAAVKAIMGYLG